MYTRIIIFFTKLLIIVLRLFGKNASALPGLVVEKLSPSFLYTVLSPVEDKIVLVTGTNGKTTSTRMVVHALQKSGARVVTNSTGSNMTRGLISAVITDMTFFGSLKPTDWFVFEMDEAYAPKFTKDLQIHSLLALNVLRDQLDRYGEVDTTAKLIEQAGQSARYFVYNAGDERLSNAAKRLANKKVEIVSFDVVKKITNKLRGEHNMYTKSEKADSQADFTLTYANESGDIQMLGVQYGNKQIEISLPILGIHNALNACSVAALLSRVDPDNFEKIIVALNTMDAPFGRGEKLHLKDKSITVALVKNPSGFTHNLETFIAKKAPEYILFVVNDRFADGRDVSWLWDVEFAEMVPRTSKLLCSGIRAYDMAVRLKQDGLVAEVEPDVEKAIAKLMKSDATQVAVIPTYTALYEVRAELSKYGKVSRIW